MSLRNVEWHEQKSDTNQFEEFSKKQGLIDSNGLTNGND